ncbi:MAG: hypothetical protein SXQ77_11875 [Halobacteria archaeon]|nr:hypothetical protein [Halobacteria archaeon]
MKIGLGLCALLIGTILLFGTIALTNWVTYPMAVVGTLALAVGSLMIGMSEEGRPV